MGPRKSPYVIPNDTLSHLSSFPSRLSSEELWSPETDVPVALTSSSKSGSHTSLDEDLELITDPIHSLLEPPSPAYTNITVRRAYIVWMYCGRRNSFQQVCNYYHYLEALEDKLPPEEKAMSRHHEFNMFSNLPPTSKYLNELFPKFYSYHHVEPVHIKKIESIKNEKCIFKLEGFYEIPLQKTATPEEIEEASKIIRNYCRSQLIPLRKFLFEFKDYATRCELNFTVNNVAKYIKRKMLEGELNIIKNYPKTFNFLEESPIFIDNNDECKILNPKPCKYTQVFKAKDPRVSKKLNPTCAAFFNSFNVKYFENKSVSCSPLVDSNSSNNSFINESNDKTKSRSVESLLCKNLKIKTRDSPSNYDEFVKLRMM